MASSASKADPSICSAPGRPPQSCRSQACAGRRRITSGAAAAPGSTTAGFSHPRPYPTQAPLASTPQVIRSGAWRHPKDVYKNPRSRRPQFFQRRDDNHDQHTLGRRRLRPWPALVKGVVAHGADVTAIGEPAEPGGWRARPNVPLGKPSARSVAGLRAVGSPRRERTAPGRPRWPRRAPRRGGAGVLDHLDLHAPTAWRTPAPLGELAAATGSPTASPRRNSPSPRSAPSHLGPTCARRRRSGPSRSGRCAPAPARCRVTAGVEVP